VEYGNSRLALWMRAISFPDGIIRAAEAEHAAMEAVKLGRQLAAGLKESLP